MFSWRKEIRLSFPDREWLPSATKDTCFAASISGTCRPGRRAHQDLVGLARSETLRRASEVSIHWDADQWSAAQDAINAVIGAPHDCSSDFYRRLAAQVRLMPDKDAVNTAMQIRLDRTRVNRLNFLKTALYSDPTLIAVWYLEQHPDRVDDINFDKFRRLADQLQAGEHWWGPLMLAWNELASKADSQEAIKECMNVLLEVLHRLDSRLANRYGLPTPDERFISPNGNIPTVNDRDE
jgi:hypothetical protein